MGNRKSIKIPEYGPELAEFLGIFLGDGGFANNYQIQIAYNGKTEQQYAEYVSDLVFKLFGLKSALSIRPTSARLVISGVALVEFFETQGIYRGDKIKKGSCLPDWVFQTGETRKASIRGLFDTDGCVYNHSYKVGQAIYHYPKLAFTSYSPIIRKQFFDLITAAGFHPKEYGTRVHVYSQDETLKYYNEIGTRNPWHESRFQEFCIERELEQLFTQAV